MASAKGKDGGQKRKGGRLAQELEEIAELERRVVDEAPPLGATPLAARDGMGGGGGGGSVGDGDDGGGNDDARGDAAALSLIHI